MLTEQRTARKTALKAQETEFLNKAKLHGLENDFLFTSAFQRYREHIRHLGELEKEILKEGPVVTKEYVKGRENIYVNPAISAYNSTAGAADKTAAFLLKLLSGVPEQGEMDEFDKF